MTCLSFFLFVICTMITYPGGSMRIEGDPVRDFIGLRQWGTELAALLKLLIIFIMLTGRLELLPVR